MNVSSIIECVFLDKPLFASVRLSFRVLVISFFRMFFIINGVAPPNNIAGIFSATEVCVFDTQSIRVDAIEMPICLLNSHHEFIIFSVMSLWGIEHLRPSLTTRSSLKYEDMLYFCDNILN